jgi:hypothetical protein
MLYAAYCDEISHITLKAKEILWFLFLQPTYFFEDFKTRKLGLMSS